MYDFYAHNMQKILHLYHCFIDLCKKSSALKLTPKPELDPKFVTPNSFSKIVFGRHIL